MIELSCTCGLVALRINRRPEFLHACNCSICAPRNVWWGYVQSEEITVSGKLHGFERPDKSAPTVRLFSCAICCDTTHFVEIEESLTRGGMVGVNLRLADPQVLTGCELRFPDGRSWSGNGSFDYVRKSKII